MMSYHPESLRAFEERIAHELDAGRSPESRDTWGTRQPSGPPGVTVIACELGTGCRCRPAQASCIWAFQVKGWLP